MKKDRRERRVRNTLTVDLGLHGLPLLERCTEGVGKARREYGCVHGGKMTRGRIVRIALELLSIEILAGNKNVKFAIDFEFAMRGP